MKYYLGIDTSAYTTSLCAVDGAGRVIGEARKVLTVPRGKQGLRQSEAVFQHVQNLPLAAEGLREQMGGDWQIAAVAATTAPRPHPGSYMPVFAPGTCFGRAFAQLAGARFYELSHQENHLLSGMYDSGMPQVPRFLAIHLSGGTTELMDVAAESGSRLRISLLGATADLHAGQFVDRIGVALGLPFPAGPELEKLASRSASAITVPSVHKEGQVSFSGPLTALLNHVGKADAGAVALGCLQCIARTLVKWIRWAEAGVDCRDALVVGGVAANGIIRDILRTKLPHWRLYFASPRYSTDNALGAALFALDADQNEGKRQN